MERQTDERQTDKETERQRDRREQHLLCPAKPARQRKFPREKKHRGKNFKLDGQMNVPESPDGGGDGERWPRGRIVRRRGPLDSFSPQKSGGVEGGGWGGRKRRRKREVGRGGPSVGEPQRGWVGDEWTTVGHPRHRRRHRRHRSILLALPKMRKKERPKMLTAVR